MNFDATKFTCNSRESENHRSGSAWLLDVVICVADGRKTGNKEASKDAGCTKKPPAPTVAW